MIIYITTDSIHLSYDTDINTINNNIYEGFEYIILMI